MRRACDQCLGTDMQYECERGQCYAEHCEEQRYHEERQRQEEEAAWEAEQQQAEDEGR
jgi:hypothetical protein